MKRPARRSLRKTEAAATRSPGVTTSSSPTRSSMPSRSRAPTPSRLTALCRPRRREGTKEKAPPKEGRDQHLGTRGDGLPSRCIRRYRLPSRCTRKKFHARPEQGNGPAADGASFSLTLKFIGVRKEPLFPSGTKTIRGLGNRSARFHHPHPSTVCVPRAFPGSHLCCGRPDCVAEVVDGVSGLAAAVSGPLGGCASD